MNRPFAVFSRKYAGHRIAIITQVAALERNQEPNMIIIEPILVLNDPKIEPLQVSWNDASVSKGVPSIPANSEEDLSKSTTCVNLDTLGLYQAGQWKKST